LLIKFSLLMLHCIEHLRNDILATYKYGYG
jgi:hypothetical protein